MSRLVPTGLLIVVAAFVNPVCELSPALAEETTAADPNSDLRQKHDFFEARIRPLLLQHCVSCHGSDEQNAGLRLDSRKALMQGGDRGAVVSLSRPEESRLLKAVRRRDDLAMPPTGPLTPQQIAALEQWVRTGAVWPETAGNLSIASAAAQHWAFQPVRRVPIPESWSGNPIDYFIERRLQQQQLLPRPEANPDDLVRRLAFTLTGLPPSLDARRAANSQPFQQEDYLQLVDELLASPHYGEHWARHWLDVARYSDTKGYVYAREERFWVHAWRYRDWVVSAFNSDLPFDRFLLLQLAGDQVPDAADHDLAAMGFLTLGRRFLGVERDIIDDRIDVVTRGTMALTVSCARCHDHKYDPIPTADYYSLYGVFDSSIESLTRIDPNPHDDAFETELRERRRKLEAQRSEYRRLSSDRARSRIRDYLFAQTELDKYPPKGFDQIFEESDLLPAFVRRWENYLRSTTHTKDPVFLPWHQFSALSEQEFQTRAPQTAEQVLQNPNVNAEVRNLFAEPPKSFSDVIDRYASLFEQVIAEAPEPGQDISGNPDRRQLVELLFGPQSPTVVPDEPIVHIESFFTSARCTDLWKLQGEVDRWIIQAKQAPPFAVALQDRRVPSEPRIFLRGNPTTPGETVPRRFLQVVSGTERRPFQLGSGRLELAQQIASRDNPLTARVIVNRVWAHHFGAGLVTTPSDFGLRSDPPSHPELLDWLTQWFIDGGWKIKPLHRLILTSAAFRRSSRFDPDAPDSRHALSVDPDNRLLWRFTPRRLSFEQLRDAMLSASGELDTTIGGKPQQLFDNPGMARRTIYGLVDRQFLPATLRVFDFANPDLHVAQRPQTTIPQQALFLMNHPFVLKRAERVAKLAGMQQDPQDQIAVCFEAVLQRPPGPRELSEARLLTKSTVTPEVQVRVTSADWTYGYGSYQESDHTITGFQQLPYFSGEAWQGGAKWPDAKLGWVQLTAEGGHPGNTRQVAAIRRWTAPQDLTVSITSKLTNPPTQGDGIRAFIVASDGRELSRTHVHAGSDALQVADVSVKQGQFIDFVVDIDKVLNSDQFQWPIQIAGRAADGTSRTWDSVRDFTGPSPVPALSPLGQLAQVLLLSNEFMFVD